jgi:hypothetical protein
MSAIRGGRVFQDERGSVFLLSLGLVFVMTLLGVALFDLSTLDRRLVIGAQDEARAFHVAEAGLSRALRDLAGSGTNSFASLSAAGTSTTLYANPAFAGGRFTVVATPVVGASPPRIDVTATGCIGAQNPCPAGHARSTVQANVSQQFTLTGLVGFTSVSFGGSTDSFDSRQGAYDPAHPGTRGDITSNGSIDLQGNATVKGSVSSTLGSVQLSNNVTVNGSVIAGTTVSGSGTVTGGVTANHPASALPLSPVPACLPYSDLTGKITGPYSYTLGSLTLSSAVTLASGSYCLRDLTLKSGATLQVDGPVVIRLNAPSDLTAGSLVNNTGKPDNLQILSSYVGPSNGLKITGGTKAYFTVYAPSTEVVLHGGADIFGAVVGSILTGTGHARLHFDEALKNSSLLANGFPSLSLGSWRQCPAVSCS